MLKNSIKSVNICSRSLTAAIFCLGLISLASPALAHRVLVYAFAEGDTIHTESKFVGSGPVQKGDVKVQDRKDGTVLLTGTTDEKGKFSFKIPPEAVAERSDLLIIVGASLGHQGEWLLKADNYLPRTEGKATDAARVTHIGWLRLLRGQELRAPRSAP